MGFINTFQRMSVEDLKKEVIGLLKQAYSDGRITVETLERRLKEATGAGDKETLIALSISAMTNSAAQLALDRLPDLRGCDMHSTHIPTKGDEEGLRRLGINVTSDAAFSSKNLFVQ